MRGFLHGPVVEFLDHGLGAGRCGHAGPCRRGAAPYAARVPRSRAEACGAETKKRRDRPRTAPAQLLPVTGARDIARVHAICETRNDQGRAIMIVLATAIGAPAFAAAMTSRLASRPRDRALRKQRLEIGRESCRERVCKYV